jgi:methyl-accepting chemotaxis protein
MPKLDNQTLLLAFIAVTGLAVLLQAFILLAIYITLSKAVRSLREQVEDLRSAVIPVVFNTRDFFFDARELFHRLTPKLEQTVEDLAKIAHGLQVQTAEVQGSVGVVLERMSKQSARVDAMLTGMLNSVDRAGSFVTEVVKKPASQISSAMAAVKAVLESLRTSSPRQRSQTPNDKKSFI